MVVEWAICALSQIARWPDGAQATVDANVLDYVAQLIRSPRERTRKWTCVLVGKLASSVHESIVLATLESLPVSRLMSLLR